VALGYGLLALAVLGFLLSIYSVIWSKLLPPTGHEVLDWLATDWYYCLLIPLSFPVCILFIYTNWLGMKFFQHN